MDSMSKARYGLVFILIVLCSGCTHVSMRKVAYQGTGAGVGGGLGYMMDKNPRDAAIGGVGGMLVGGLLYDCQKRREDKNYKEGFDQGLRQTQVDCALNHWEHNTGKKEEQRKYIRHYQRVRIPKREVNGVVYDQHYETVEVLR